MSKIKWVRKVDTATVGTVAPGDVSDVIEADAERYIRNGWAVRVPTKRSKPPAGKGDG